MPLVSAAVILSELDITISVQNIAVKKPGILLVKAQWASRGWAGRRIHFSANLYNFWALASMETALKQKASKTGPMWNQIPALLLRNS